MQVLIDLDVCLYLALSRVEEDVDLDVAVKHLEGIVRDVEESYFQPLGCSQLFLSFDDNFRKVDYPTRYKANRAKREKHLLFDPLKKYAVYHMGAFESPGGEADDYLLMAAAEANEAGEPWVIATVDKDLRTMPGRFYNLRTQEETTVTWYDAYKFMMHQFVMGDPVDAIPGFPGVGPKKVEDIVDFDFMLYRYNLDRNDPNEDITEAIGWQFEAMREYWSEYYEEDDYTWQEEFNYTCNAAFIRRRSEDLKPLDFATLSGSDFAALLRLRLPDNPAE